MIFLFLVKDLCVIHDLSEDHICADLIAFTMKFDSKELNLALIDDFQTDYLDKKAITVMKKSKAKTTRVNKTPNTSFNANKSFNSLLQLNDFSFELKTQSNIKPKLTTQVLFWL